MPQSICAKFFISHTLQSITLGGGCFLCTEAVFVRARGVADFQSGYCNGDLERPR